MLPIKKITDCFSGLAEFSRLFNITSSAAMGMTKTLSQQTCLFTSEFWNRPYLTQGFNFLVRSYEAFASTLLTSRSHFAWGSEDNEMFPFWILIGSSPLLGKAINTSSNGFSLADKLWEESIPLMAGLFNSRKEGSSTENIWKAELGTVILLNTKFPRVSFQNKIGQSREEPDTFSSILLVC